MNHNFGLFWEWSLMSKQTIQTHLHQHHLHFPKQKENRIKQEALIKMFNPRIKDSYGTNQEKQTSHIQFKTLNFLFTVSTLFPLQNDRPDIKHRGTSYIIQFAYQYLTQHLYTNQIQTNSWFTSINVFQPCLQSSTNAFRGVINLTHTQFSLGWLFRTQAVLMSWIKGVYEITMAVQHRNVCQPLAMVDDIVYRPNPIYNMHLENR